MNTNDSVLTLEEAAQFLKISETTLYQLIRAGKIPTRKVGREWRFLKSSIIEWLTKPQSEEDEMNPEVKIDQFGGEYKVENGKEKIALWLPLSLQEKEALLSKAKKEGTSVSEMVAEYLKNWLSK